MAFSPYANPPAGNPLAFGPLDANAGMPPPASHEASPAQSFGLASSHWPSPNAGLTFGPGYPYLGYQHPSPSPPSPSIPYQQSLSSLSPGYSQPSLLASSSTLIPPKQLRPRFKDANRVLVRLGWLGARTIILFALLNLVFIVPARQTEIGFSSAAKKLFNSAVIFISLIIARAVKHFYEECAKVFRWVFLCRAHTLKDAIKILDIDSITTSSGIVLSFLRGKSMYRRKSEVFLIFVLFMVALINELGVALLGFTFEIDDVSYLEKGDGAYMTNWGYIGQNNDLTNQALVARTYGLAFLSIYGGDKMENPLDLSKRGLHWTLERPTEYFYTLVEWDDTGAAALARPSRWPNRRNITLSTTCFEPKGFSLTHVNGDCSINFEGDDGKPEHHRLERFNCDIPETIFLRKKEECGPRCTRILVAEAWTGESSSTKMFSCDINVGEVLGTEDLRGKIPDVIARTFASSIARGSYVPMLSNATISHGGALPLNGAATPSMSFHNHTAHPARQLNLTDAQWVAAILSRFAMASISSTDGANPRFRGPGMMQVTLDRLQSNVEFLNGIIAAVGGFIILTLFTVAYSINGMEIPDDKDGNIVLMLSGFVDNMEYRTAPSTESKKPNVRYVSGVGFKFVPY